MFEKQDVLPTDISEILRNKEANTSLSSNIRDLAESLPIEWKFHEYDLPNALLSNNTLKHCAIGDTRDVEHPPFLFVAFARLNSHTESKRRRLKNPLTNLPRLFDGTH
jgi:hypothetical protein